MIDVPDSFDGLFAALDFSGSLSDAEHFLVGKVVQAALHLDQYPGLGAGASLEEYWSLTYRLDETMTKQAAERYDQLTVALFDVTNPSQLRDICTTSAFQHLILGLVSSIGRDQWRVLLSPFQVVAAVPEEWRQTVADAVDNLGLVAAFALPGLVPSSELTFDSDLMPGRPGVR